MPLFSSSPLLSPFMFSSLRSPSPSPPPLLLLSLLPKPPSNLWQRRYQQKTLIEHKTLQFANIKVDTRNVWGEMSRAWKGREKIKFILKIWLIKLYKQADAPCRGIIEYGECMNVLFLSALSFPNRSPPPLSSPPSPSCPHPAPPSLLFLLIFFVPSRQRYRWKWVVRVLLRRWQKQNFRHWKCLLLSYG